MKNIRDLLKQGKGDKETERHAPHYVTIQKSEERYEAGLIIDNANSSPAIQAKLNLAGYRIQQHPQPMRNAPRLYTTKKLTPSTSAQV